MKHEEDIFREGSRIGVLLIHGLGGTPKELGSVAKVLHSFGFTVSIPVLPGHCGSMEELIATRYEDWQAAVDREVAALQEQCDVLFVGGLCAGALMSVILAERFPRIRGIFLYSVMFRNDGWGVPKIGLFLPYILRIPFVSRFFRLPEAYPYGIKNENLRERIVMLLESGDSTGAGHQYTPGCILREMHRIADKVKKLLPRVTTPALVIHAQEDEFAGPSNARYVKEHIGGPAELLILEDSYHLITVDQERKKVAKATARFCYDLLSPVEKQELATAAKKSFPVNPD